MRSLVTSKVGTFFFLYFSSVQLRGTSSSVPAALADSKVAASVTMRGAISFFSFILSFGFEAFRLFDGERHFDRPFPAFDCELLGDGPGRLLVAVGDDGEGLLAAALDLVNRDAVRAELSEEIRVLFARRVRLLLTGHHTKTPFSLSCRTSSRPSWPASWPP